MAVPQGAYGGYSSLQQARGDNWNPSMYIDNGYGDNSMNWAGAGMAPSERAGITQPSSVHPGGTGSAGWGQTPAPGSTTQQAAGAYPQQGGSQSNPYLAQGQALANQVNQNLTQNIMPGIRSGAMASGQYGGSRQGIAEGIAAGNASTGIAGTLANYNLGLGNLSNNATAQNQNFYSQQRGQDLQQYQIGAGLYGQGITGQVGVGQGQYGTGQTGYQAPLTTLQNYSNVISPFSGLGSSQIGSTSGGGNAVNGALGGALAGGQIARNLGMGSWGSSPIIGGTGDAQTDRMIGLG